MGPTKPGVARDADGKPLARIGVRWLVRDRREVKPRDPSGDLVGRGDPHAVHRLRSFDQALERDRAGRSPADEWVHGEVEQAADVDDPFELLEPCIAYDRRRE